MTGVLLIGFGAFAVFAMTTAVAVAATATRPGVLITTIGTDTQFPVRQPGGWKVKTLDSLSDVESFMDFLENHSVAERELVVLANDVFAVRWKAA